MKSWPQQRLRTFAEVKHEFAFKSQFFCTSGKYVLLTPGNFREEGGFRWLGAKQKFYSNDVPNGYILKKNDLLIAMTEQAPGLLGSTILIPEDDRYLHNQRLGLLQINKPGVSRNFIYHVFNSLIVRRPISTTSAGTKVKHTSPEKIGNLYIPAPPVEQQTAIADLLSTWDTAIEKTERLIAAKQQYRRGLVQQLLSGKRRFPGLSKPWRKVRLGNIFKRITRKNSAGIDRVLTASGEHGLIDQKDYFNKSVSGESLEGYYHMKQGEFAYNRSAMSGYPYGAIKRLDDYPEGVLSTLYLCFSISSKELCSDFIMHYLEAGILNQQLRKIAQVGSRAHGLLNVTAGDFFDVKLQIPESDEQEEIALLLNHSSSEISFLQKQLDAFKEQKKGLMQQLLTGKVRVKIAKKDVA